MAEKLFYFKRGLFDNLTRELIISDNQIKFQNTDLRTKPLQIFNKNEIVAYRFGVSFYQYFITFGREYLIEIMNKDNKTMTLKFNTYFKNNLDEKHKLFNDIGALLWQNFFYDKSNLLLQQIYEDRSVHTCETLLNPNGIIINNTLIPWRQIDVKLYYHHFVIFSTLEPLKFNVVKYFLNDWNAEILYSLVKTIITSIKNY